MLRFYPPSHFKPSLPDEPVTSPTTDRSSVAKKRFTLQGFSNLKSPKGKITRITREGLKHAHDAVLQSWLVLFVHRHVYQKWSNRIFAQGHINMQAEVRNWTTNLAIHKQLPDRLSHRCHFKREIQTNEQTELISRYDVFPRVQPQLDLLPHSAAGLVQI